ncbi:MAG: hypothetical protein EPN33_03565 [Acidobacteria bacterium]|nr:MAG: hypothetical protein EPN33_03565 [Acidobacteriota bacterium]
MRFAHVHWSAGSAALLAVMACAQARPSTPGIVLASAFSHWSAQAQGPIVGNGQPEGFTMEAAAARFTLPDGTSFSPFAVGDALLIAGDGNPETVTILAANCPSTGQTCSITADFTKPHPGRFIVSSGTDGLQEAINYEAAHGGGIVEADPGFGGNMTTLLPLVKLPAEVLLIDGTGGQWTYYGLGNGGEPVAFASFSSTSGTTLTALRAGNLNGALFAYSFNFAPISLNTPLTGGSATVVTLSGPVPKGILAGDTLYLSGSTGAPEVVTVTSTGTSSISFTPQDSHTGTWTLTSATSGLQEAVNAAGSGGWVVDDETTATLHAPLVLARAVRLTGFAGSTMQQLTPNTDVIDIGTAAAPVRNVTIEYITAEGVSGSGSDTGAAFHCVSCALTQFISDVGEDAHDGLYFDSANGNAYDNLVTGSHFTADYYGVRLVGGSANRDTFAGDTVDHNVYGVFDDGGWDHVWTGDDIEYNSAYGYWQQVSQPANYSGHNIDLQGDYFEGNGNTAGQGDVFLGQLVAGGGVSGNNGAGCINCEVTGSLFNAANASVTALNLGAVMMTVSGNTYSGYAPANVYATITGPTPNFSRVLLIGDCGTITAANQCSGAQPNTITQLGYGALTLGGTDQLTDSFGTELHDTTIESPTGVVRIRGVQGGAMVSNPAQLDLDGNSTSNDQNWLRFDNQGVYKWAIMTDIAGNGGDDFCPVFNLANPASGVCQEYVGPNKHFEFSSIGPPGTVSPTADYDFLQMANGDSGIMIQRATDTAPTGYLLDIEDSTDSHPLFRVDASGNVTGNGGLNVAQGALFQSSATINGTLTVNGGGALAGTFTGNPEFQGSPYIHGTLAMDAGTVGGKAINTDPAIVRGASGTAWGGTYTAGQCITGGVSFSTGVAVGNVVTVTPQSVPPAGLVFSAYIDTANHVTIAVCNLTSASVTWTAGTIFQVAVIP